jgi:hypothetical protein
MNNEDQIVRLAGAYWRLLRLVEKLINNYPPAEQEKYKAQYRFGLSQLNKILEENNIQIRTYNGSVYSANLPVNIVNSEDFEDNDNLIIVDTIEPTFIVDDKVAAMGKVALKKGD